MTNDNEVKITAAMTDSDKAVHALDEAKASIDGKLAAARRDAEKGDLAPGAVAARIQRIAAESAPTVQVNALKESARVSDLIGDALAMIRRRKDKTEQPVPVPWRVLGDALQGGFWPGVHVLVSGTGAGKSTLATDLAIYAAKSRHPVGIVSLELSKIEQTTRLIGAMSGFWWSDAMTGRFEGSNVPTEWRIASETSNSDDVGEALARGARQLDKLPISIVGARMESGSLGWRPSEIQDLWDDMAPDREASTKDGGTVRTPLIIIDYLQLVAANEGKSSDPRERVGQAAIAAHHIATSCQCAVLLISSLGRGKYPLVGASNEERHKAGVHLSLKKKGGKLDPGTSDAHCFFHNLVGSDSVVGLGKESGEVEFSATTVMTMTKVPGEGRAGWRALMLAKNRYGQPAWTALELNDGTFGDGNPHELAKAMSDREGKGETRDAADRGKGETKNAADRKSSRADHKSLIPTNPYVK